VRTLTIVFVGLVALPAGILGWLGFQYASTLEGDSRGVIERETDALLEDELRRVRDDALETEQRFDQRAEAEAREWARRLPFVKDIERSGASGGTIDTPLGTIRFVRRIETASGELLNTHRELTELPEWGRFVAMRDTAMRGLHESGDWEAATARLRAAAGELVSPRLRDQLVGMADAITLRHRTGAKVLLDTPPIAAAAMPHGARLTLLVEPLPGQVRPSGTEPDARGLGWRETVVGPLTRAGLSFRVRIEHPRAAEFSAEVRQRKLLTAGAIGALLLLMVVGLWLARRALMRERAARELRDAFIANVSHELKTPLTSVRMYAEMLADGSVEESKRAEYGRVVDAEGARLAALVDDMLDFSALERGARELEIEPTDIARLACATVEAWRPIAEREGVELDVDGPREGVTALADAAALGRIVTNLLQNALKHGTPPRDGETRRIRVCIDGGLTVCDNGPGIPAREREAMFDRFRRGADTGNKAGAGIGLALSRELARAMNGDLFVEDDGTWTRFSLKLPPVPNEPA